MGKNARVNALGRTMTGTVAAQCLFNAGNGKKEVHLPEQADKKP